MEYFSDLFWDNPYIEDDISSPIIYQAKYDAEWTIEEDQIFEKALALHDLNSVDLFEKIALDVPGKTMEQIKEHFQLLVEDVKLIEAYAGPMSIYGPSTNYYKTTHKIKHESISTRRTHKNSVHHKQKRKGTRWTKEEHEKFLLGLSKYGKGDWRSISRNVVLTKTPTQVASHAQKYFIRQAKLSSSSSSTSTNSAPKVKSKSIMTTQSQYSPSFSACLFHQLPSRQLGLPVP